MSDTKSDTPNASTRKSISITSSLSSSPSYIKRNLTTEDNRSKDEGNSKKLKLCTEETSSSSSRAVRSTSDNKSHSSDRKDSSQSETGMGRLIADHYNKSKNDTVFSRRQSPIFHLRAFNNFIKSLVIDQMLEKMNHIGDSEPGRRRVIDIGCGKGGDLRKYMVNNVGYLLCTGKFFFLPFRPSLSFFLLFLFSP